MSNTERLASAVGRMQEERAAFLRGIEGLSQAELDFKPARDSWSVGEVAHHVGLTETMFHRYMADLLRSGSREQGASRTIPFDELPMGPQMIPRSLLRLAPVLLPFTIMSSFMPESVQSALLANPLVKVKTAPAVEPKHGIAQAELFGFLRKAREATLELLAPVQDWDLTRFRWFHPLMGGHDVYGTLELVASHDRRHAGQVERVKSNPKFPRS
ncbi:MAG: DinB family protein [Terriglobia bacterium]